MTRTSKVYWALLGLFGLALFVHVQFLGGGLRDLTVADEFTYDQSLDITGSVGRINLLMYIPTPRLGLEIRNEKIETADLDRETPAGGLVVVGGQRGGRERHIRYRAQLSSLALTFTLDPDQPWTTAAPGDSVWLAATDVIQSDHPDLARLLATLVGVEATPGLEEWDSSRWQQELEHAGISPLQALRRIYNYANDEISPATFSGTTDALSALRLGESSCGGKSRIMVALCRRLGLPSRIIGGVIMNQVARKRTHHLWVETKLGEVWVPCDPLNNYFAHKPAHFLTLYVGDLPLIRHSRGLTFDYGFSTTRRHIPLIWLGQPEPAGEANSPDGGAVIPLLGRYQYSAILLAPFGLLLIVFARQVVGLESIGTFLPILLGFSLIQADWLVTGVQMVLAILLGVLMRFLLTKLNLLHVPRAAVMITFVVLTFLVFSAGMSRLDSLAGVGTIVLPIAALAMAVEKFTLVAMDKGTADALRLLGQTLLLAVGCRAVMVTPFFQNVTIAFPEVLVLIVAMIILLGNYRGLRWRELWRFRRVDGRTAP